MARHAYILSYDIRCPQRWRQVHRLAKGHGDPLQLSVFKCALSAAEAVELRSRLEDVINHGEDQVLLIDLGPVGGTEEQRILSLGRHVVRDDDGPTIV